MKKPFLAITLLLCTLLTQAQFNIVPKPVKLTAGKGTFQLSPKTTLVLLDQGEQSSANALNDYLQRFYGFKLNIAKQATTNYIRLATRRFIQPGTEGKYNLQVDPKAINIEGDTYQGTFYGVQTLIQLLPPEAKNNLSIPAVTIEDQPRFEYRGLHLDVGRHFASVDFVKKYIDYIAMHKMNYFHWHLTEDQGWRIEIKKYPKLTSVGGYRNGTIIGRYPGKGNDNIRYGGYYTQDEIKEVVAYAATRYVTIIPEIEMPGHSSAAIAAYPWLSCFPDQKTRIPDNMISEASKQATGKLVQETWGVFDDVFCAGNDSTYKFLQDVLDEVMPLFPGQLLHIGGDECPKTHWKKCPRCQQRMKENNLKDEHELQSYFIQRMERYINSKGKTIIGWDEILEGGLAPNAIVMSWRGEKGGVEAANQNHKVIMTPGDYVYLDHTQTRNEDSVTIGGFTPLDEIYGYEPIPKDLPADKHKFVMGAQGNVWREYMKNDKKVEYMVFPRLAALSEVLWSPKEKRDFKDFEKRLPVILRRYDKMGINYSRAYYDLKATISAASNGNGVLWAMDTKFFQQQDMRPYSSIIVNTGKQSLKYSKPALITKSGEYSAVIVVKKPGEQQKMYSTITQKFTFTKSTGKKITLKTPPSSSYPGNPTAFGLINGALSEKGISSPEWHGWSNEDMEATIDLLKATAVSSVKLHTMEQNGGWIYLPTNVEVLVSKDGKNFTAAGTTTEYVKDNSGFLSGYMTISFPSTTVRYIKVIAKNLGKIPEGKPGAGNPAWLFVDELQVF